MVKNGLKNLLINKFNVTPGYIVLELHLIKSPSVIEEVDKYLAYTFNFAGFALMTPLGKVALEPVSTFNSLGLKGFICYFVFCVLLLLVGTLLILHGRDRLET